MNEYQYLECCIDSTAQHIHAMQDMAKEITFKTLQSHCNKHDMLKFQKNLGYDTGAERGGLRMKNDWAVSYYKSIYKGMPCYYINHSRIEYIFVRPE
jgi:hypothetical protein